MELLEQADRLRLRGDPLPDERSAFSADVLAGLSATQKTLPCRYIYDERGSRLFEEICALPEYYLTRAEAEILREHSPEIVASIGAELELVELGSGSAEKTRHLIAAALGQQARLCYRPMDISRAALLSSARRLLDDFPALEIEALVAEYVSGLHELSRTTQECDPPRLLLWLGSSIGNFPRAAAVEFMRHLRGELRDCDAMLLGADLRKHKSVLDAAYDDAAGVTARFNKNLLVRINRELGGDFDLDSFRYVADYEVDSGRVKMSLVAERDCQVRIAALGRAFDFVRGEAIESEDSYKYSQLELDELALASGFVRQAEWLDSEGRFSSSLLRPR
jgi:L-histidine Nalpha-methyltransferase